MNATKPSVDRPILQIAGKVVLRNDLGKVLILRESAAHDTNTKAGRYHLIGGRIEPGESFFDGLQREVLEETGFTITIGQPLLVGEWRPIIKGVPHQIVGIYLSAQVASGSLRLSEEHDDFQWIDPRKFADYDIVLPDRDAVAAYIAGAQRT
jgi:8-oxo-dGTP diphosphatase